MCFAIFPECVSMTNFGKHFITFLTSTIITGCSQKTYIIGMKSIIITSFVTKEECIQKRGTVASIIAGCSQRTHMHSIRYYKVWIKTYSQDMGMSSGFLQHLKELFSLCINLYALSLPLFFWPVLLLQLHQQQHLFGRLEWLL